MTVTLLLLGWLLASLPFGIIVGRSIALADRRAADLATHLTAERE